MTPAQLRAVALSFPEAEEVETWDQATFRVRKKMFCILGGDGVRASLKATREQQAELLAADPAGAANTAEVAELLEEGWRQTPPKRVAVAFDSA